MSIKVTCFSCESNYELDNELSGKEFSCPKCGNIQILPEGEEKINEKTENISDNTLNQMEESEETKKEDQKGKKKEFNILYFIIGIGILVYNTGIYYDNYKNEQFIEMYNISNEVNKELFIEYQNIINKDKKVISDSINERVVFNTNNMINKGCLYLNNELEPKCISLNKKLLNITSDIYKGDSNLIMKDIINYNSRREKFIFDLKSDNVVAW